MSDQNHYLKVFNYSETRSKIYRCNSEGAPMVAIDTLMTNDSDDSDDSDDSSDSNDFDNSNDLLCLQCPQCLHCHH